MPASPALLLLALAAAFSPLLVAACGGSTASGGASDAGGSSFDAAGGADAHGGDSGGGGGLEGGDASEGGTGACAIAPPGSAFTFHIHNGGASHLGLAYGCGGSLPVLLSTPAGALGIGPGPADGCELTCTQQYAGPVQQGCSDCGPGVGADLPAGTTVDLAWDHRVYVAHTAAPECVGGQTGVSCALAEAVVPSATQTGTLTVCTGGASSGGPGGGGYCGGSEMVSFTVDTTQAQGTIEVK